MKTNRRSAAEIDALKANWLNDPCYDIADTEGFEAHATELANWQYGKEMEWKGEREAKLIARAAELNCSPELVEVVERLERRVKAQDEEIEKLQDRVFQLEYADRQRAGLH